MTDNTRHFIAQFDEFKNGEQKVIEIDNVPNSLLAIRLNSDIYVVDNLCTHQDKPLKGGRIIGEELMCPFHAGRFCLKTGKALSGPVGEPINSYKVEIIDQKVFVHIP